MDVKKILLRFGVFVLKSLCASILISFVSLCLITKKFPPDLSKAKELYTNIKKLKQISQKVNAKKVKTGPPNEEEDIAEYLKTRQELGAVLSQLDILDASTSTSEKEVLVEQCLSEKESIKSLKAHIQRLDAEVSRLNLELIKRTTVSK